MNTGGERMNEERESPDGGNSFTSAMTLTRMGLPNVPSRYVLPLCHRASPSLTLHPSTTLPIIDLSTLNNPSLRSQTIHQVHIACKELGFFQVINHGIPESIVNGSLEAAKEFFDLPAVEKMQYASDNVHEPVRYGTSMNHSKDKVHFWRDFIKLYSHPILAWIHLWPSNPPTYREKMGNYSKATHALQKQIMEVVLETLGLNPSYLNKDIEDGSQVLAVNCYPACPEPDLALGMPPHSDYGSLTILNQSWQGLEIMDHNKKWHPVPVIKGALMVQLGDQMEVISNGRYKSIVHRATVNSEKKRFSIASLHSLAIQRRVGPAPQLVDEKNPSIYREGSFGDFLDFISGNDILLDGRFIDTLKKNPN